MSPLAARWFKVAFGAIAALLALAAISVFFGAVALPGAASSCANSPLFELLSPNGEFKAVAFSRDCGATTSFSTQVSLLGPNDVLPKEGGNLFAADTNHNSAPSGPGGGPVVRLAWAGPSVLRVERHPLARVFLSRPSLNGVQVEYAASKTDG